jgi:hypothetical protein
MSTEQQRTNDGRVLLLAVGDEILPCELRVVGARMRRQVPNKLHHLRIRMHHCLHLSLVSPGPSSLRRGPGFRVAEVQNQGLGF